MTSYDATPYPLLSHVQSHPSTLATLATLLDLMPAGITNCRVLEVGCAVGGNLIPMALSLPGSQFVGIDNAARQIAEGRAAIAALGLPNVRLEHLDILEVTPALGEFDFIIAHGIYSWVPAEVRVALLRLCRQNLAPNGLAFVSYNTFPGWHMLGAVRDMLLYHTRNLEAPAERAAAARELLGFLAQAVPNPGKARSELLHAYSHFLNEEMARIGPKADAFLLHDELEDINQPFYFHEFVAAAERHGLQFVSEIDFRATLPSSYPPAVFDHFRTLAHSLVELEQYLDFFHSRTLRQTLLCPAERSINRQIRPERVESLWVASRARPENENPSLAPGVVERFQARNGAALATDHPVSKAAMLHLASRYPQAVPFADLLAAASAALPGANGRSQPSAEDRQVLAGNLVRAFGYTDELVELHAFAAPFTLSPGPRPVASPWARWQAREGRHVTNLRHDRIRLEPLEHFLLQHLDGQHDHAALVAALQAGPLEGGHVEIELAGHPVDDPAQAQVILSSEIATSVAWLAQAALLVA